MSPAYEPREPRDAVRLLVLDPQQGAVDGRFADLPSLLAPGDLLVVNDAATLPASLMGKTDAGESIEVRLVHSHASGGWRAVLLGAGSWRMRTEDRPPPPVLGPRRRLRFADLTATVDHVAHPSGRLLDLRFEVVGAPWWDALYRIGRPVQYSHLRRELQLWSVQTVYASRPWAVEMPSAGRPLTGAVLSRLRDRGVQVATLTHAAGLSAIGHRELDAQLPLPERYDLPPQTVAAIHRTRAAGGRVIAVGTTVVRALEGAHREGAGELRAGASTTDLVIGPGFVPQVVDGLISGIHDPSESHFRLLGAFAPRSLLDEGLALATRRGYESHEFGDSCLVLGAA